jgi:TolB protein
MYPAPTPDGRALIYAGNPQGEGVNLWWHPLDGSPERRLTIGTGEYTEPFVSRSGTSLVCLARRRRAALIRVPADASDATAELLSPGSAGDTQPSIGSDAGRIVVSSTRSGDRRIWSLDIARGAALPLTSGNTGDDRPSLSPDGKQVAFLSSRDGAQGLWVMSAEGAAPRLVARADVLDAVSWSSDNRRIAYAVSTADATELWIADTQTGRTERVPGDTARAPGWSPRGDVLAVVRVVGGVPQIQFIDPHGAAVRDPIAIVEIGQPMALSWSPDGSRLALVNLPGRGFAEAWTVDLASGQLRRVVSLPPPHELDGVAWTPDGRSLILGRIEFDNEVLLVEGLPQSPKR